MPDVSMVMNFHREGLIAHRSLVAMARCVSHARSNGVTVEVVAVCDRADKQTSAVIRGRTDIATIIDVDLGDPGLARNHGTAAARGRSVAFCDGDDYLSQNWLTEAHRMSLEERNACLVPEYVVNFGAERTFAKQLDVRNEPCDASTMLAFNPWNPWGMLDRAVAVSIPFEATRCESRGFGYEDWHWRCELMAHGIRQLTVPETAGFYRRKDDGLLASDIRHRATIKPSSLFSRQGRSS